MQFAFVEITLHSKNLNKLCKASPECIVYGVKSLFAR
jgi:hypothetical protein